MVIAWLVFTASALAILWAGQLLASSAERIARATSLSQGWIGFILVAVVTSLPELVATMTGGGIDAPGIAIGNALGSNAFNLGILGLMGAVSGVAFFRKLSPAHMLSATGSIFLTALVLAAIALGGGPGLGRVSLASLLILVFYLLAVYAQFRQEEGTPAEEGTTLGAAPAWAALSGVVIVVAGVALTYSAKAIAEGTGIAQSAIGSILVALATSLPEVASSIGALRLRAYNLLAGDIFGSNLFNIATVFFADLTFGRPILGALGQDAWPLVLVGAWGISLAAFSLAAMQVRGGKSLRRPEPASSLLFLAYLGGLGVLVARGFF